MTKMAFVVNGDERSAIAERANAFALRLRNRYNIGIVYRSSRKTLSAIRFFVFLVKTRPRLIYVVDMSYSGVLAGVLYKLLFGAKLLIDTGDAIYDLAQSMARSPLGLGLTRMLEAISFRAADRIVVRGTFHKRLLEKRGIQTDLIQDGVDTSQFKPMNVEDLRKEFGLEGVLTVGLVGSVVWNAALGMCYGSEIVEVIHKLRHAPVKGVVIGDGTGLAKLKDMAQELGVEDSVQFLGRVAYDELPRFLNLIDLCISTQTNDVVGQVRTTGKLPLYMATGRYVLATRVGEATLCLPEEMLVEYNGKKDPSYVQRLCEKVEHLAMNPEELAHGLENVGVARTRFDYSVLVDRLATLLDSMTGAAPKKSEERLVSKPDLN